MWHFHEYISRINSLSGENPHPQEDIAYGVIGLTIVHVIRPAIVQFIMTIIPLCLHLNRQNVAFNLNVTVD